MTLTPEVARALAERIAADYEPDPLAAITPPEYVERLTGAAAPAGGGKIHCPLPGHEDERTPSFHVYAAAERGWHCYGCGRGGTIYDLAGALWGLDTRGAAFLELRSRLADSLGVCLEGRPRQEGSERNGTSRRTQRQQESGATSPDAAAFSRTDLGNAQRFAAEHADRLRHVRDRRVWLAWDGTRWRRDATGDAERAAKRTVQRLFREAARLEGEEREKAVRWALQSQSERGLRAMLSVAATEQVIALRADQLDRNPWLISCTNGTLDLRTSELRPHRAADLITLRTDVSFERGAACPRWRAFLRQVFEGDEELIAFVQRFVGYCLTGDIREHVLVVLHGSGCNGKSTFIGVLKRLLGDYALTAAFETFIRQRSDRGPRNDLARLHRARLVTAAESGDGRRLDEATVKEITGGDTITARFLYGEHFEFVPQFKLVLVTNCRPHVDGDDDAIWRRLRLVPFEQSFEGREDRDLGAKLEAELPGILAWAVHGCVAWQHGGLGEAAAVTRATAEYRQDEDVVGAFLDERCLMEGEVAADAFRKAYEQFCEELGLKPLAAHVLGKKLKLKRGIARDPNVRPSVYRGVRLR
jgi:putative DNA primase/helicase